MNVFKIRHPPTGLFSTGGSTPRFTKNGKTWKTRGHLTRHLDLVSSRRWREDARQVYVNCEIVEFEIIERCVDSKSVIEYLDEQARESDRKKACAAEARKRRNRAGE